MDFPIMIWTIYGKHYTNPTILIKINLSICDFLMKFLCVNKQNGLYSQELKLIMPSQSAAVHLLWAQTIFLGITLISELQKLDLVYFILFFIFIFNLFSILESRVRM